MNKLVIGLSALILQSFVVKAQSQEEYLQKNYNRETKTLANILELTKKSYYIKAEATTNELQRVLMCREKANEELYNEAYELSDSIYKLREIAKGKKAIYAAKPNQFPVLEKDLQKIRTLIGTKHIRQAIARLGEVSIKLANAETGKIEGANLKGYQTTSSKDLASDSISIIRNQVILDKLEIEFQKEEVQNDWDSKSILDTEINLRRAIQGFITNGDRYLSAKMDYGKLAAFVKNPWPMPNPADQVVYVPTTKNQLRLEELKAELLRRHKANIHLGTWQLAKEEELRIKIERYTKEGNQAEIDLLLAEIKEIPYQ